MVIDPIAAGAAFVTYWLRGRYGAATELEAAGRHRRWRVDPVSTGRPAGPPFELHFEVESLGSDLGHLRQWLESVAEDASRVAPDLPGHYVISALDGITRTALGAAPRSVRRAG